MKTIAGLSSLFDRLTPDPEKNIHIIVHHAAELIGGACALYNRLNPQKNVVCTYSGYGLPPDFAETVRAACNICYGETFNSDFRTAKSRLDYGTGSFF